MWLTKSLRNQAACIHNITSINCQQPSHTWIFHENSKRNISFAGIVRHKHSSSTVANNNCLPEFLTSNTQCCHTIVCCSVVCKDKCSSCSHLLVIMFTLVRYLIKAINLLYLYLNFLQLVKKNLNSSSNAVFRGHLLFYTYWSLGQTQQSIWALCSWLWMPGRWPGSVRNSSLDPTSGVCSRLSSCTSDEVHTGYLVSPDMDIKISHNILFLSKE